jgi:DNA-directed RNA polymerase subunit F
MFDISDEQYKELRLILQKQNGQIYTPEEVKEIGDGLIDFYALLMQLDNKENNI